MIAVGRILVLVAAAFAVEAAQGVFECSKGRVGIFDHSKPVNEIDIFLPENEGSAPIPLLDCGNGFTSVAVEVEACAVQLVDVSFNTEIYLNSSSRVNIQRMPCSPKFPIHLKMTIYC